MSDMRVTYGSVRQGSASALEPQHLESHLVNQIKVKDPQFCSRHMKCFELSLMAVTC
jgi:hypothetical protein